MDPKASTPECPAKRELKKIEEEVLIPETEHEKATHFVIPNAITQVQIHYKIAAVVVIILTVALCVRIIVPNNGACQRIMDESHMISSVENLFLTGICLGTVFMFLTFELGVIWLLVMFLCAYRLDLWTKLNCDNNTGKSFASSVMKSFFWMSLLSIVLFLCPFIGWEICYGDW